MTLELATHHSCRSVPASRVFAVHPWAGSGKDAVTWLFAPGMLFGSRSQWWRTGSGRPLPHEGLDFYGFAIDDDAKFTVGPQTTVPLLYDGEIARSLDDFLGVTLFVKHAQYRWDDLVLHTVYGHVAPEQGMAAGTKLAAGKVIGRVAAGRATRSSVPPHLHLSMALVPESVAGAVLDWSRLAQPDIVMCNPLEHLTITYHIDGNSF